jgi:zinc/manganese transport system permease protein
MRILAVPVAAGFSWNPASDVGAILSWQFMRSAYEAGTVVAIVSGVVGYFVVLRRTAFAAHALSDMGFPGAAGAALIGVDPVVGMLVFTLTVGAVMGLLGERVRGRDTVIGIVLAFSLALGYLFSSLYTGNSTEAFALLFGQITGVSTWDVVVTVAASAVALAAVAVMYRPLLFASVDEVVAEARRVPVRTLSVGFMLTLALAVSAAVQVIGVLLIFALLVTPAAIAERLTRRPGAAIACASGLAVLFVWVGLAIAYYQPYPPSFFIVGLAFVTYVAVRIVSGARSWSRRGSMGRWDALTRSTSPSR